MSPTLVKSLRCFSSARSRPTTGISRSRIGLRAQHAVAHRRFVNRHRGGARRRAAGPGRRDTTRWNLNATPMALLQNRRPSFSRLAPMRRTGPPSAWAAATGRSCSGVSRRRSKATPSSSRNRAMPMPPTTTSTLVRLRDTISKSRPPSATRRQDPAATVPKNPGFVMAGDLPEGRTVHGDPGAPPPSTDMTQFKMHIPIRPDERQGGSDAGQGKQKIRKG